MKKTEVNGIFENILNGRAWEAYSDNGWSEKMFNEVLAALALVLEKEVKTA